MTEPNTIRGSRIGAGPMGEAERGEGARRTPVSYWCASRHETRPSFAADAVIPETWECPRCGSPAGQDEQNPPRRPQAEPYRTHLAYVKERRSPAEGEAILAEALARLHGAGSAGTTSPAPGSRPPQYCRRAAPGHVVAVAPRTRRGRPGGPAGGQPVREVATHGQDGVRAKGRALPSGLSAATRIYQPSIPRRGRTGSPPAARSKDRSASRRETLPGWRRAGPTPRRRARLRMSGAPAAATS